MKKYLSVVWKTMIFLILPLCVLSCKHSGDKISADDVTPEIKNLTLMVYMAADNDLESYALQNLKAMERSQAENINVLVLLDRCEGYDETDGNWTDTRLFEVVHDSGKGSGIVSKRLESSELGLTVDKQTELDMADGNVLKSFVEFSKENFEAKNYALIIWGHGTGWRYSYAGTDSYRAVAVDDRTNRFMSVTELGKALKNQGLCVIGFDTCFGAVIENLYELKDEASYITASPGITPSGGWNYKNMLEELSSCDFEEKTIAQKMCAASSVAAGVYNASELSELKERFEKFSKELSSTVTDTQTRNEVYEALMNSKSYSYTHYPCDKFLDIYSMAELYKTSHIQSLALASQNLIQAVEKTMTGSAGIGVHFIPLQEANVPMSVHSVDYVKNGSATDQCSYIKESQWWVPTINHNSGSLLDKLFYTVF